MAKELLLEIGLEEMPAHVVTPSMKQLEQKTAKFLDEHQLSYDTIETFSTPKEHFHFLIHLIYLYIFVQKAA